MKKNTNEKNNVINITKNLISRPEMGVLIPLIFLFIVIGFVNPNFFAINNLIDILRSGSYTFVIAAPLTLLMISGGMDLSIGATTALGCVVCAWGLADFKIGITLSILIALFAGALVGIIKATLVVKFNLPAFIITLALTKIVNSFILVTTDGIAVANLGSDAFKVLGQGKTVGGIHWTIIIAIIIGIGMHILLTKTRYGREVAACGGNRETAKLAGINVAKTRYIVEVLVSLFSAFCG
ncbi:MAG: ABC transporter permease, partial [Christensenellaceae bacterium]|nr:ABC transporter permease [Christensenellaceae bacterium]